MNITSDVSKPNMVQIAIGISGIAFDAISSGVCVSFPVDAHNYPNAQSSFSKMNFVPFIPRLDKFNYSVFTTNSQLTTSPWEPLAES